MTFKTPQLKRLLCLSSALALMAISQLSQATLIHSSGYQSGVQNLWGQHLTPLENRNSSPRLQPKEPSNPFLPSREFGLNPPVFCKSSSPLSCVLGRRPNFFEPTNCNAALPPFVCGNIIPIDYSQLPLFPTRPPVPSTNVPEPSVFGLLLLGILLTSANRLHRVIKNKL